MPQFLLWLLKTKKKNGVLVINKVKKEKGKQERLKNYVKKDCWNDIIQNENKILVTLILSYKRKKKQLLIYKDEVHYKKKILGFNEREFEEILHKRQQNHLGSYKTKKRIK